MTSKEKEKLFNSVYAQWVQPLYRYAYYQSRDQQTAEDLVQEAYVKYWNKILNIEKGKEKSYLYTCIRNSWLNKVEHHKVVMKFESFSSNSSKVESPQYLLEMKEFQTKINEAIAKLPNNQREVFLMNRIDGMKYREIADCLELSQKAVEKRMSKALLALRKVYRNI